MPVRPSRPAARRLAIALLGLLLPLSATASARAERKAAASAPAPVAVNGGFLWRDGIRELPTLRHAEAIGATPFLSVRTVLPWSQIEPEPPDPATGKHRFDWRSSDRVVSELARFGRRVEPILGFSTPWGSTVTGVGGMPPRVAPFANYAAAIARRYGRKGEYWRAHPELPYVPIVTYAVWNEPNLGGSWIPGPSPPAYADLYAATRAALLDVDPHARVAIGGLAASVSGDGDANSFLRQMYTSRPGLRGNVDAVGVTVYTMTAERVMKQIAEVRATLDGLGERSTPIDLDETGWTTSGFVPLTDIQPVSEAARGALFTRLVELAAGSDCGLGKIAPYAWVTHEDNAFDASAFMGVADRRTAELKPSGRDLVAALRSVAAGSARELPATCARPDLVRALRAPQRAPAPLGLRVSRQCKARKLRVRYTLGDDPEPFARFVLSLPGRKPRTIVDPDGGGPAVAPTSGVFALPRPGVARIAAFDELDRERAGATARVRRCPRRPA